MFYEQNLSWKYCDVHRKTLVLESLFKKASGLRACNFIRTLSTHLFSYEYCEIFKNTFFEEHLRGAASVKPFIDLLLEFKTLNPRPALIIFSGRELVPMLTPFCNPIQSVIKRVTETSESSWSQFFVVLWGDVLKPWGGRCSIKKTFLKISQNSQENACVGILFLNKIVALNPATLLKKRLRRRCFLMNFAEISRTYILQNIGERLFFQTLEQGIQIFNEEIGEFESLVGQ